MSWDAAWEQVFRSRAWGKYPPEELIRFIALEFRDSIRRSQLRILDLGCGTGASLWYLAREGFDAYGIDGSRTAVQIAKTRMTQEKLDASIGVSDLTALPYLNESFDGAIDVASIQHNVSESRATILREAHRVLKPNGRLFLMMIKRGSWGWNQGKRIEPAPFSSIREGPFAGKGRVHFFSKMEIVALLRAIGFRPIGVELSSRTQNSMMHIIAHYVVCAEKA
jgi:SAM-dependent methyltransferase